MGRRALGWIFGAGLAGVVAGLLLSGPAFALRVISARVARELFGLATQPSFDDLELRARSWQPHRATAARILWHDYLSVRGRE